MPSPRHRHTAVLHDNAMWVYGGMNDLQEKSDFWRFDFGMYYYYVQWAKILFKNSAIYRKHTVSLLGLKSMFFEIFLNGVAKKGLMV